MTDKAYQVVNGTYYDIRTPDEVVKALELARKKDYRVRLFLGDRNTGEAWSEEHDVTGTISRSMGPVKAPLLMARSNSIGGGAILDHCVVGVLTRTGERLRWLYKHPTIDFGQWTYHSEDVHSGERAQARRNGTLHAQFDTLQQAVRYCDFMTGKRMSK